MTRIVGLFMEDLDSSDLRDDDVAAVQGFAGRTAQTFLRGEGEPVIYLGLGTRVGWQVEQGYQALEGLSGLMAAGCNADRVWQALCSVTDEDTAREVTDVGLALALGHTTDSVTPGATVARAIARARAWTNASAAELNPTDFVALAEQEAVDHGLSFEATVGDDLASKGLRAILAMGSGSPHPPALIDLTYTPPSPRARVTLIGKGVTFDTGGLSLKSPHAMSSMRQDKCGAATILAVMGALQDLQVEVEVRALLPVIENMIGPRSMRPGDSVDAWDGTRITVLDTDFEGRVILADALALASSSQPDLIVDVATLTYQVVIALGPGIGGLFSRDDATAALVKSASESAGEPLWRLPYDERYLSEVRTATGVKNHPESENGRAITAALFLGQFVPAHLPWAHLDISGPAWRGPAGADGATGFGVRTILSLLRAL